uniref:uncharacterized protein LOC127070531 n=1 Tax=Vespula vulgaris TaxID=7454 RepID=UPI00223BC929|nr:uncharacterized protein LOC127070531 [Vespula vulgaris]
MEDTEVIYSTAWRPPLQTYLRFRPACVSAKRNGKVGVLSPPWRTQKLYIRLPDGPRLKSTYVLDAHAFPQVVKEESRDTSPPWRTPKLYIPLPGGPRFRPTYDFDPHAFPQVVKEESRDTSPPWRTPKLYIPLPGGPRFRPTYDFDPHAFPQNETEKWECSPHHGGHRSYIFDCLTAAA